ncbi:hypothetical protein [Staphylococcus cohnii]|uniref:hypothetical protein n=1 Tax=Staphylococcus cohnii TaxID=29382 RepID=UPI0011A03C71|nr:hypothetical protein [Staphylococcus arlettae]MDN0189347.1 hypothetical protein [Staphylococcus arlettae]QKU19907.1 hypothetical protein FOC52_13990 [Staphylococcus cohnii]
MAKGTLEDVTENPNLYKIGLVYKQRKKYIKLPTLNLILGLLLYGLTTYIAESVILSASVWFLTIIIGIYALMKFKQCRELLGKLMTEEINKQNTNTKKKVIVLSKWGDWKLYTLIIINIIIASHCLTLTI